MDSLGCCSRAMSRKVKEGPHVYSPMLVRLMMAINRMKIHRASDLESTARELVARAVHWPMSMDHRQLPEDIALGITSDKQQFTYHFCGDHLGGNRVLCADMHFPFRASNAVRPMWIIGDGSKFIQSAFPFTKPCVVNAALTCRLSCVAYFEVTFGAVALHIQDRNSSSRSYGRFNRRPCMSVGLVNPRSSLHDRMPGWDSFSYGIDKTAHCRAY